MRPVFDTASSLIFFFFFFFIVCVAFSVGLPRIVDKLVLNQYKFLLYLNYKCLFKQLLNQLYMEFKHNEKLRTVNI
jgi:hypothetical protein